jgi:hypothetical protein
MSPMCHLLTRLKILHFRDEPLAQGS